jgi:hypothetical protein
MSHVFLNQNAGADWFTRLYAPPKFVFYKSAPIRENKKVKLSGSVKHWSNLG